jgi:MinD-like ATPase involved in chromosome partitioning or flagellar assembly
VCRKYFGLEAEYLGYVNHDEAVSEAIRARQPVVVSHPQADAAVYLTRIARKLIDDRARGREAAGRARPTPRAHAPAAAPRPPL